MTNIDPLWQKFFQNTIKRYDHNVLFCIIINFVIKEMLNLVLCLVLFWKQPFIIP